MLMSTLRRYLMPLAAALSLTTAAHSFPLNGGPTPSSGQSLIQQVQSRELCGNWHRECARLYGHQTQQWHQCMNQPGARWDCGRGGYGGGRYGRRGDDDGDDRGYYRDGTPRASCSTWRRECAKLYGWQSQSWHSCMTQPGARRACN
jgi:hypothetical protein